MSEVKRGRPRKVQNEEITNAQETVELVKAEPTPVPAKEDINSLAKRIWDGQSPDLFYEDRMGRITNALKDKGYDLSTLTFKGSKQ